MTTFDQRYRPPVDADAALRPLLERLHSSLVHSPVQLADVRVAIIAVTEFLSSPIGRTDANCRAVDFFLMQDEAWDAELLPEPYVDVLNDLSGALHDAVSAPDIAVNFESTPEQLLERARRL